jgi:hypothetical protein
VRLNRTIAFDTVVLEFERGSWNLWCSGEMRRYHKEHQWRRRRAGSILTLMHESVGSEQD